MNRTDFVRLAASPRLFGDARRAKAMSASLVAYICLAFIAYASWLGYRFKPGMVPDHEYHEALLDSVAFQDNFTLENRPELARFGAVSTQAPLYYQLLAIPLRLFGKENTRSVVLWTNVIITLAGFAFLLAAARRFSPGDARLGAMALWTTVNFAMYAVLATLEQYDNLTNALGLALFSTLLAHAAEPSAFRLFAIAGLAGAGMLTKMTFMPLACISGLLALALAGKGLFKAGFWASLLAPKRRFPRLAVVLLSLCFATGAVAFYGRSVARYGSFTPACEKVLPAEECAKNWAVSREKRLVEANKDKPRMAPLEYFLTATAMLARQWDDYIGGAYYRLETKPWRLFPFLACILAGAFLALRAGWRPHKDKPWLVAAVVFFFYYFSLLAFNYMSYKKTGTFGIGLWFRYLFPVAAPLVLMALGPAFRVPTPNPFRWIFLASCVLFLSFAPQRAILRRAPTDLFLPPAPPPPPAAPGEKASELK